MRTNFRMQVLVPVQIWSKTTVAAATFFLFLGFTDFWSLGFTKTTEAAAEGYLDALRLPTC